MARDYASEQIISTHDLTRRSTCSQNEAIGILIFQLTTSRGGRPYQAIATAHTIGISTHDLTRRSTNVERYAN